LAGFLGGMAGGATVSIVIKAIDEYSKTFSNAEKSTSSLGKAFSATAGAVAATTAVVVAAGVAIGKLAYDGAEASSRIESFNKIIGEESPKVLEELRKATMGTIDDLNLMSSASTAVTRGVETEMLPSMLILSKQISDINPKFGDQLSIMDSLTMAIAKQSDRTLTQYGIMLDMEKIQSMYTEGMSDEEKQTIFATEAMAAFSKKMNELPAPIRNTADAMQGLKTQFKNAYTQVAVAIEPLVGKLIDSFTALLPTITSMVPGIISAITMIIDAISPLIEYGLKTMMELFTELKPVVESIIEAFKALAPVVMPVLTFLMEITKAIIEFGAMVLQHIANAITATKPIWEMLGEKIGKMKEAFIRLWDAIKPVVEIILTALEPVLIVIINVLGWLIGVIADVITWIANIISTIFEWITSNDLLMDIFKALGIIFNTVGQIFMNVWTKVKSFWDILVGAFKSGIEKITGFFTGLWDTVKSVFGWIGDKWDKFTSALGFGDDNNNKKNNKKAKSYDDFLVTPSGQVLDINANDYIMGFKNPSKVAGGSQGGLNLTITGDIYGTDPRQIAIAIQRELANKINY